MLPFPAINKDVLPSGSTQRIDDLARRLRIQVASENGEAAVLLGVGDSDQCSRLLDPIGIAVRVEVGIYNPDISTW